MMIGSSSSTDATTTTTTAATRIIASARNSRKQIATTTSTCRSAGSSTSGIAKLLLVVPVIVVVVFLSTTATMTIDAFTIRHIIDGPITITTDISSITNHQRPTKRTTECNNNHNNNNDGYTWNVQRRRHCLLMPLSSSSAAEQQQQHQHQELETVDNQNKKVDDDDTTVVDVDRNNKLKISHSGSSSSMVVDGDVKIAMTKQQQQLEYIRSEGGRFSFRTKYGALNPFALYYGITSILLGIPWFMALSVYQLLQVITWGRFDRFRRIPVHLNQLWGESLLVLTRCFPEMIHRDILQKFYKQGRPAMFVANHNSWMDIPFLGTAIGWKNYKLISKAELGKVPILGKAIKVGGHIMVSRDDPRSQIRTLKQGIQLLKDGVHLCTFPEGTRTRTGRLSTFKNGAFKMAHKAGAPVIPISIVAAEQVMPIHWMFPHRPARGIAQVVIHEPIESVGKTEAELATAVRNAIISGLPQEQRPLEGE